MNREDEFNRGYGFSESGESDNDSCQQSNTSVIASGPSLYPGTSKAKNNVGVKRQFCSSKFPFYVIEL